MECCNSSIYYIVKLEYNLGPKCRSIELHRDVVNLRSYRFWRLL